MPYQGIKPAGVVPRLNRSHPHARGLVAFYVFHEGGGLTVTDIVSGLTGTLTSGPTWVGNPGPGGGYGVKLASASSQYIDLGQPTILDFNLSSEMAVAASYQLTTVPFFVQAQLAGKGSQWALDLDGPNNGARFYVNNGGAGGLWAESRAMSIGENRTAGGSFSANQQIGYGCWEGVATTVTSVPYATLPSAAVSTRFGITSGGGSPLNGVLNWVALWNRYVPPGVMAEFQRDPFACLRRRPVVAVLGGTSASGGTTISTTSALSLGSSAALSFGFSISTTSAVSLGAASTVTLTSPSLSISTTSTLSLGASAAVSTGMSFSASSGLSLGSSAAATFTTATTISTSSALSLGAAAAVEFASSALSISTTSAIGLGSSAGVTFVGPPTTIDTSSAVSLGAATTVTLTSPALSISTSSALSLGSSAALTFTSTGVSISTSSALSLGSSAAVTLTTATTIVASSSVSLGAASTVTFTSAYATLLEAVVATLKGTLVPGTVTGVWFRLAPPRTSTPYVVVNVATVAEDWASVDSNDERPTYDTWTIDVSTYHTGSKLASTIGRTIATTLTDAALTFDEGTLLQIAQSGYLPPEIDPDRDPTGSPLWRDWRSFTAVVQRLT